MLDDSVTISATGYLHLPDPARDAEWTIAAVREHGWHLVALLPRQKKLLDVWDKSVLRSERAIRHALGRDQNIGLIATKPAIDIDNLAAYDAMAAALGPLPDAWVKSGGGEKYHVFVRSDVELPHGDIIWDGVVVGQVISGARVYTVLPPSRHPDTDRPYAWRDEPARLARQLIPPTWRDAILETASRRQRARSMAVTVDLTDPETRAWDQPGAHEHKWGVKFQCPACAALGRDLERDNAILFTEKATADPTCPFPAGAFGCAVFTRRQTATHYLAIQQVLGIVTQPSEAKRAAQHQAIRQELALPRLRARLTNPRTRSTDEAILYAVITLASRPGRLDPFISLIDLALIANVPYQTTHRAVRRFLAMGILHRLKNGRGTAKASQYVINLDQGRYQPSKPAWSQMGNTAVPEAYQGASLYCPSGTTLTGADLAGFDHPVWRRIKRSGYRLDPSDAPIYGILRYREPLTPTAIATILYRSPHPAEPLIRRIRKKLRTRLLPVGLAEHVTLGYQLGAASPDTVAILRGAITRTERAQERLAARRRIYRKKKFGENVIGLTDTKRPAVRRKRP